MELTIQNPYTVELAHRWFVATFEELLSENRAQLREMIELEDRCTILREKTLNSEIRASYHLCLNDDDEIEMDYIIELFDNPHISCKIPVYYEACGFVQNENEIINRVQKFCSKLFYICKCGQLAKPRLGVFVSNPPPKCVEHRCESCYLYWFKRTDDRCAICLEDEGVWVKLSCGHIIHQHCWVKIFEDGRCPVCRVSVEHEKSIYKYPYLNNKINR